MRIAIVMLFVLVIPTVCCAQQPTVPDGRLTAALAQMANKDLAVRNAGFDDFVKVITEGRQLGFGPRYSSSLARFLASHPEQADRVKLGLINLLQSYDDTFMDRRTAPGTYTENDTEHWAQAIDMVASLDDDRAIPALVGAMTTGGMASAGVGKYGQKALRPVLSQINNPDPLVPSTAGSAAIRILRMKNDSGSQAQILGLIRTAIRDPEYVLRSSAVSAIENLSDQQQFVSALQDVVPVLHDMSQHDPYLSSFATRYPLRERASKLLEKIANH